MFFTLMSENCLNDYAIASQIVIYLSEILVLCSHLYHMFGFLYFSTR